MKNIMKGMIVVFSVLMVGLIGIMTYALVTGSERLPLFGTMSDQITKAKLINTQTVSMEDVEAVDIDNSSYDVVFKRSESEEMVIKEYGKSEDKSFVTADKNGKTLNIESTKNIGRTWFVLVSTYRYYEVYLPESYSGSMEIEMSSGDFYAEINLTFSDFKLDSASGYVDLQELSAANIVIETTSGDVEADYLEGNTEVSSQSGYVEVADIAGDAKIKTSSGDIDAGRAQGNIEISSQSGYVDVVEGGGDAKIETSSGDIEAGRIQGTIVISSQSGYVNVAEGGGDAKIETSSGDININNITGNLSVKTSSGFVEAYKIEGGGTLNTTSGDVDIEFTALTNDLMIETNSGYVSCEIPQNTEFQFEANTGSGYIDTNFEDQLSFNKKGNEAYGLIGDAADYQVIIKTTSGDVDVSCR